jgi:hypothetical protein
MTELRSEQYVTQPLHKHTRAGWVATTPMGDPLPLRRGDPQQLSICRDHKCRNTGDTVLGGDKCRPRLRRILEVHL